MVSNRKLIYANNEATLFSAPIYYIRTFPAHQDYPSLINITTSRLFQSTLRRVLVALQAVIFHCIEVVASISAFPALLIAYIDTLEIRLFIRLRNHFSVLL